jgi:hypothetical protein
MENEENVEMESGERVSQKQRLRTRKRWRGRVVREFPRSRDGERGKGGEGEW